ncbi:FecR domain-containing protein [Enhygromyxa salina]|uniref:FecR protein n=1 Tax=Enhygromyxa salina TaxID=215803 RepID=A0A2S9YUN7_9BACT|nr:FecR domain-containing protein [Enhygromyxa salina]PRQ08825.1 FecR protein [Enhygromyxa salina]
MTPDQAKHGGDAQRWEALIDREVVGESLSDDERAFVREYEAGHPECAKERELWALALDALAEPEIDAVVDTDAELEQLGARALAAFRAEQQPAASLRQPRRRPPLAAMATLAAAAGLLVWLGTRGEDPQQVGDAGSSARPDQPVETAPEIDHERAPASADATPVDSVGWLSMSSMSSTPGSSGTELGGAVGPGAKLSVPGCVSWANPSAVVCFEGALELPGASEVGQRRVHLDEGRLVAALDPLGPGQRFTVETVLGSVTAIGTVFAVESHEGRVWVTVLEGRVELRDPSVRLLEVGQRTSMRGEIGSDEPSPVEVTPTALTQLAGLAELLRASPGTAQLSIPAQGELSLQLDGHALGGGVMDLSLAAGVHALGVFDDRGELLAERRLELEEGEPLELAGLLGGFDAAGDGQARVSAKQPTPSAKQLAEAAQRERAAGHHGETAGLYRALLEHYPDSPEAVNVPVRLGDLLASTGDHVGALEAYDLYLERGAKQLAPEAEFGRILALRALGRRGDEAVAIAAFLSARPDDYRRGELEGRLARLVVQ